jgi:hypothetical protein
MAETQHSNTSPEQPVAMHPLKPPEGQLNPTERRLLKEALSSPNPIPEVVVEVGTWLGGGSTLHILRALEKNQQGHLWGIEACREIYEKMLENIRAAAPEALHRFTPLFGFSQEVLPNWIAEHSPGFKVDFAFLDGGNNPLEQVHEFRLLEPHIPVGGQLMAHDAKLRKGKWLRPYLSALDNWQTYLHDVSEEGLLQSRKVAAKPSPASQRAANRVLWRLRMDPAELAGALLPRSVCSLLLQMMPRRLAVRLGEGRSGPPKA